MPKRNFLCALAAAALLAAVVAPHSNGQAGGDDPLLAPLIADLATQQNLIAENQAKIDEKLATIGENLRVARIFVGRGGGKAASPAH